MDAERFTRQARTQSGGRKLFTLAVLAILAIATIGSARAQDDNSSRREVAVTLNAGESYVIKNVGPDTTPAIHVVDNPQALVIHSDKPGEVVLLGAEAGEWDIDVTDSSGESLRYAVRVNAMANPFTHPLEPGMNPPALGSPHFSGAAPASKVGALAPPANPSPAASSALVSPPGPATITIEPSAAVTTVSPTGPVAAAPGKPSADASASASAVTSRLPSSAVIASSAASPPSSPISPSSAGASAITAPAIPPPAEPLPSAVVPATVALNPPVTSAMASSPMLSSQNEPGELEQFRSNPSIMPRSPSISGGDNFLPNDVVELAAGSSRVIDFQRRIRRISIADSDVADVEVITPYQINLIGHKEGFTTLAVWDTHGRYIERQIRVDPYGKQQVMLNVIVAELDRSRLEQQGINWTFSMPNRASHWLAWAARSRRPTTRRFH